MTVVRIPSYDGTVLGCRRVGNGPPLLCLPGGPGRAAAYLDELGGLSATRTLLLLDQRGVGLSDEPADPSTYRADRLVDDVEAARAHLGLDSVDLLAHSAGASLALLYAVRFAERIGRLVLVTPSLNVVRELEGTPEELDAVLDLRRHEPWYVDAHAALMERMAGEQSAELTRRTMPFFYGRWDGGAAAHAAREDEEISVAARAGYYAGLDVDADRVIAGLGALDAPVLVITGGVDLHPSPPVSARLVATFRRADHHVQPGAGHMPWLDDPAAFTNTVEGFLART